jgi:hypothetical protein
MVTDGINFGDYWRNELGTEFRKTALEYIGGYTEKIGEVKLNEDGKHYEAVLDISDVKDTIFPLGVSCNMTTRETRLVAKIITKGRIGKGKFNMGRHIVESVSLYDIQNNEIENKDICIDSLLFMLDFLDSKK